MRALDSYLANVGSAPRSSLLLGLGIFGNNLRVALLSNVFSLVTFGTLAFLVPAVAFTQIGFVASSLAERGGNWLALGNDSPLQFLIGYVLPTALSNCRPHSSARPWDYGSVPH